MAVVKLIDNTENRIVADDGINRLPVGISLIRIKNQDPTSDPNYRRYDCEVILEMIEQSSKKSEIGKDGIGGEWSLEYLALFAKIMRHCDKLHVCGLSGDLAYGCFAGGLIQHDGLGELKVDIYADTLSSDQAELIFAGVASSSCLEKFQLYARFADTEAASRCLIEAMKKHLTFKSLDLFVTSNDHARFVKTALLETRIQHLRLGNFEETPWEIPFDTLVDLLCRDDCVLESLDLGWLEATASFGSSYGNEQLAIAQNQSVKYLTLEPTIANEAGLVNMLRLFKSLVKLDLWKTSANFPSLDPLYPLLLGDNLTLQSLILGGLSRAIAEHVAILPMKKLKPFEKSKRNKSKNQSIAGTITLACSKNGRKSMAISQYRAMMSQVWVIWEVGHTTHAENTPD